MEYIDRDAVLTMYRIRDHLENYQLIEQWPPQFLFLKNNAFNYL